MEDSLINNPSRVSEVSEVASIRLLVAGESWVSAATHFKGFDFFSSTTFHTGVDHLRGALGPQGIELVHMPSHQVGTEFPLTIDSLRSYHAVLLSDIGSNSLLLHPDTWLYGKPMPNRLKLLREYVVAGGGLAMAGGYYSYQGIYGAARYHGTAVEEVLPVEIQPWDDRVEVPEGFAPEVIKPDHPIVRGLRGEWPPLLGYNAVQARAEATVIAVYEDRPILATREVGQGRTLAWTSDVGPHWCSEAFLGWHGFATFWGQAVRWLAGL